jgi:hypothetical protein
MRKIAHSDLTHAHLPPPSRYRQGLGCGVGVASHGCLRALAALAPTQRCRSPRAACTHAHAHAPSPPARRVRLTHTRAHTCPLPTQVKGYPTIKVIHKNEEYKTYRGARDTEALSAFLVECGQDLTTETA